jgi:hypothetical protein
MSTATMEFTDTTKNLGDQIVGLTLKEAKDLSVHQRYLQHIRRAGHLSRIRRIARRLSATSVNEV